jgi:hypothetical protein
MNIKLLLSFVLVCTFLTPTFAQRRPIATVSPIRPTATNDNSQVLPIKRVILYSNGVAYIERRGIVSNSAEINLQFKQSQVDDVLKSMVVLDLGQGRIGAVSYNSSAPPNARLAEIPFGIGSADVGGIAEVLSQLQGAKVAVTSSKGATSGSILTVEKRTTQVETNKPPIVQRFLVIASESGELSSFPLDDLKSVKLLEEGTRKDVNDFANATASARRRDAKTITVTSEGSGQREMVVSYIIAAPIWKTTYRVVLDEAGKPFFQGWAIVDNVSDEDWSNVKLSLVSGSPISFIQPIQKPMYRYRPVVPMPEDVNLEPQIYDEESRVSYGEGTGRGSGNGDGTGDGDNESPPVRKTVSSKDSKQVQNLPTNVRDNRGLVSAQNNMVLNGMSTGAETSVSEALTNNNSGVTTAATGEEIGDLFEYKIEQPMTVLKDRSALIPIVQTKMDGERISIYNEAVRRDRPMGGMLLKNLTNLTLESGSLTVLDRDAYAGEALMERLKPKEQRLISYALDLGTLVTVENKEDKEPAKLIKAVNGVFEVHYFQSDKKIYKFANQTDRKKVIYVEYPVKQDWTLSPETPKPDITTQRYYRFRVELDPFEKEDLIIGERQGMMDSYQLRDISYTDLELFLKRRYIDDATKAKLQKLIDLRSQINQIEAKLNGFDNEEEKISDDQKRLRENIEALSKTPEAKALITRYIDKVNVQETRIEAITKERETLNTQKLELERQLAAEIRAFAL